MPRRYRTVDVFTRTRFGGNPLAVVLDAEGLTAAQMQAIAREFNYSETSFVLPPRNAAHTAEVRIFTPAVEVPFAGHPNVGTAFVLARERRGAATEMIFEEKAGLARIRLLHDGGDVVGAQLTAPQPLSLGETLTADAIGPAIGLSPGDIDTRRHAPVVASVGLPFVVIEIATRAALARARVDRQAFDAAVPVASADAVYLYCRERAAADGDADLTARMFAPHDGLAEDPATGSATAATAALLSTLSATRDGTAHLRFAQGVDMGRPSRLDTEVDVAQGRVAAVRIGGHCVPIMRGELEM